MGKKTSIGLCGPHWEKLRVAIRTANLDQFTAKSGKEVVEKLKAGTFEPLIGAHNAIIANYLSVCDQTNQAPAGCPICYASAREMPEDYWIDNSVIDQLSYAYEKGFLKKPGG